MARVLLTGFYGRGNAGDEAILQRMYETLKPHHDVAIAFHPVATHPRFQSWYPYNECQLMDETSIGKLLSFAPDALVIGGGGLPPAFAAHLALTMRVLGRPTLLVGTDNLDLAQANPNVMALQSYMGGFRYIGLRYERGVQATRAIGVDVDLGADWAITLKSSPADPPVEGLACAVTVRAWDAHFHDSEFRFQIHALFRGLRAEGYDPFLLPVSPDDEHLAGKLAPIVDAPVASMWWNPRAIKGLMARCELVVSVGRLHPLIFAAPLGVPVCHVMPPIDDEGRRNQFKVAETCREFGLLNLESVDAFLAALRAGAIVPSEPALIQALLDRWESMAKKVLAVLTPPVAAPSRDEGEEIDPKPSSKSEPLGQPRATVA